MVKLLFGEPVPWPTAPQKSNLKKHAILAITWHAEGEMADEAEDDEEDETDILTYSPGLERFGIVRPLLALLDAEAKDAPPGGTASASPSGNQSRADEQPVKKRRTTKWTSEQKNFIAGEVKGRTITNELTRTILAKGQAEGILPSDMDFEQVRHIARNWVLTVD